MAKHRATGRPRGRPPKLSADFGQQILEALRRRVDPETGLVRPLWKTLAQELGVSRSTISRQLVFLRQSGAFETLCFTSNGKIADVFYRLNEPPVDVAQAGDDLV